MALPFLPLDAPAGRLDEDPAAEMLASLVTQAQLSLLGNPARSRLVARRRHPVGLGLGRRCP